MIYKSLFILPPDFPPSEEFPQLGGPIDACVAKAKRLGYDGVEFCIGDPDRTDAGELEEALARHEMKIACINSGSLQFAMQISLVNADRAAERQAFEKLQAMIRLASRVHCPVQVGVARGFAIVNRPIREFRDRLVDALRRACDYAGSLDVPLVLEYTNRFIINTLNSGPEAREVIRRVDRPNLGLLLDTQHSWIEDGDVCEEIRLSGELLKHMHFHDSNYRSPGISLGELDFDKVFQSLRDIGYRGFLSDGLFTGKMPDEEVRRSTAYLDAMIGKYGLMPADRHCASHRN